MTRRATLALLAACAVTGAGCGSGADGPSTSVVVTRDFGAQVVAQQESVEATKGLTAMRQLQGVHKVTTSYGGRYIDSINGVKEDGDSSWLIYVDGIELTKGAASTRLSGGQHVQWDFHAWQTIRTGGAIVGAYPQPLKQRGVRLICAPERSKACGVARRGLAAAGITISGAGPARVVVGAWSDIEGFDGVPDLTSDGETNGAYAQFSKDGSRLTPFSADGSPGSALKSGAGLLAPFAAAGDVTWVVSGTDDAGVQRAAGLLGAGRAKLRHRFTMIVGADATRPLPEGADG